MRIRKYIDDDNLTKTLSVDSKMIDLALSELAKLIMRLDKNSKKTRKEQNLIKKLDEHTGYNPRCRTICQIEKEYKDEE